MKKIRYFTIGYENISGHYKDKQKIEGIYAHVDTFYRIKKFKPIACFDLYYKKALEFKKRIKIFMKLEYFINLFKNNI